jgi:hypothetical protein
MAAIGLLLKDGALQWFNNLDGRARESINEFGAAFKKRYVSNELYKWKDIVAVFDSKQTSGQSVADFSELVQWKGLRAGASEDQILAAVINGLSPYLRKHVLQHEPKTIEDVRKWGMLAESDEGLEERPLEELAAAVAEMKKQCVAMRELQEQLKGMKGSTIANRETDIAYTSPAQQHRVQFGENECGSIGTPPGSNRDYWNANMRQENDSSTQWRYNELNQYYNQSADSTIRDTSYNDNKGSRTYSGGSESYRRNNSYQSADRGQYEPSPVQQANSLVCANQTASWNFVSSNYVDIKCQGCGDNGHLRRNCSAWDARCEFCGKTGHFTAVCRAAQRGQ